MLFLPLTVLTAMEIRGAKLELKLHLPAISLARLAGCSLTLNHEPLNREPELQTINVKD